MRKIKIAQIGTSANSHGNEIFQTLINTGTKKTVELKPLEWYTEDCKNMVTKKYERSDANFFAYTPKQVSNPFDRYDTMIKSFGEYIFGTKTNPWDYDYELELYKIINKCCEG